MGFLGSPWAPGAESEYNRRQAEARRIRDAPRLATQRNYAALVADFQKREESARAANIKRETEIRGIYADIIGQGQGAARTAGLADIERTKTQAVGAGTQQMISSGLFGTTTAASIPVQAEQTAGFQRLKLEDMLQQRTNVAKLGLAGFAERIETPYPDYSMLMQAYIAQGSR
jgi:hypothetical protein